MNKQKPEPENEPLGEPLDEPIQRGPNLLLIYGLMLVALLVAIGLATMVVWPFYAHRH